MGMKAPTATMTVNGRRSRRFYSFANRWVVSEVSLARQLRGPRPNYVRITRSFASAKLGRLGMMLTQYAREGRPVSMSGWRLQPVVFACPVCRTKLEPAGPGEFRCPLGRDGVFGGWTGSGASCRPSGWPTSAGS